MKARNFLLSLLGLLLALNVFGQGQVIFRNTPASAVIDAWTGLPVVPGVATAGLYYTTDLNAQPNPAGGPGGAFSLAAITPVAPNAAFPGIYSGGTISFPGLPDGTEVLLQVWTWSQPYTSWQEAVDNWDWCTIEGDNSSNLMHVVLAGTGGIPPASISTVVEGFTFCAIPEPSTLVLALLSGLGWCAAAYCRRGTVRERGPTSPHPQRVYRA